MSITQHAQQRDYLTLRTARTLREAENDPMAWRQSGRDAAAEEERIRQMFEDGERGPESRSSVWAHRVIGVIVVGVVVAVLMGKL